MDQRRKKQSTAGRTVSALLAVCCLLSASCSSAPEAAEARDVLPPVIYASDVRIPVGGTADFMKDVRAHDLHDGDVGVEMDDSEVNTDIPGYYTVRYKAEDSTGNIGEKSIRVTVSNWDGIPVDPSLPDALADEIVGAIITDEMSERERAEAVFDWITENIRYRFSFESQEYMGDEATGAYMGLTDGYGTCWTFYSVSALLLTKAGIENMRIKRVTPAHYWNLVRVDGEWYHFDTTPYVDENRRVFLLTDAELAEYNGENGYYVFDPSLYPHRHED